MTDMTIWNTVPPEYIDIRLLHKYVKEATFNTSNIMSDTMTTTVT